MRFGRFFVNLLRLYTNRDIKKRKKEFPPYGKHEELIDVPFIKDGKKRHMMDVIYGDKPKKKCCIIDIHGGSYICCAHIDQYRVADYYASKGYDFVSADYIVNDGHRSMKDIFDDLYACFMYVFAHLKELKLEGNDFVIMGDSAGGHLALTMSQLMCDKEYAKEMGYEFPEDIKIKACLVNCPVYDFVHLGDKTMTKSGMKRMFGTTTPEMFVQVSPKEHMDSLTIPLFLSTCKKDFLRNESIKLAVDMKDRPNKFQYIDLRSDTAGHVHNIINPFDDDGVYINDEMIKFIEESRKM